jgi:tetratricopeptide (TPR) repeat protein
VSGRLRTSALVAAVALLLVVLLGGQALADAMVPEASAADTDRAVGRAASAYLSGIKTFAAAILWNRLDVLHHGYYANVSLAEQRYLLSSVAMVQALDPKAVQSYYVGSWVLIQNDRVDDGIDMARRGVEHNPQAGILLMNYAQLLMLYADDLDGAVAVAQDALDRKDELQWTDITEEHNAWPIIGAIFRAAGRDDLDAVVQEELERIDAEAGDAIGEDEHDHDHDGEPDH